MHENSRLLYSKYALDYIPEKARVLEIGPNRFPSTYQQMCGDRAVVWETIDIHKNEKLTHVAESGYEFPIADSSYDVVISGQVLEHVPKIWRWMREVSRVCRVGGTVITISPVSWPYHEAPVDCWRVFPKGMCALYEDAGLEVALSKWESLEAREFRNHIPGRSPEWQPPFLRNVYRFLGRFGLPVECAYDTITIGRKSALLIGDTGRAGP